MGTITTELIEAKRDERGRHITTTEEREALLKAYRESGLTQAAFARREGVMYVTFVSWVQAARRRESQTKAGFAEVTLPRLGAASLEVQLLDGTLIGGNNAEEVAQLLRLIRC
jgi:transposase-like protein